MRAHATGERGYEHVILGVCESRDGNVNILALHPYRMLKVRVADIAATSRD